MAVSVVGKQSFTYLKFLSRSENGIGLDVPIYAAPITISGQIQAVPRNLFQQYGLDFQKTYLTFFVSKDILDIERDVSGDQIIFNSNTYQCLSETDWFNINGWKGVLTVKIT